MFFQRFSCGNSTCTHTYIQRTSTCQSAQASSTRQTLFCLQDRRFFHETDSFNFMRRTFLFMRQTLFWQDRFFCFYETQLFCLVAARAGLLNHPVHHAAPCPENQHLLFFSLIFHAAGPPSLDVHARVQKYMYAYAWCKADKWKTKAEKWKIKACAYMPKPKGPTLADRACIKKRQLPKKKIPKPRGFHYTPKARVSLSQKGHQNTEP